MTSPKKQTAKVDRCNHRQAMLLMARVHRATVGRPQTDPPEPADVVAARKVLRAWHDKQDAAEQAEHKKARAIKERVEHIIAFGTVAEALAAVEALERDAVTPEKKKR